ncbi:hypothetical protein CKA32_005381 [Geitlerinema sp. FC II]|nr:hypothetical protein CKA32_005381 [Geitlerinema sp. FC II]
MLKTRDPFTNRDVSLNCLKREPFSLDSDRSSLPNPTERSLFDRHSNFTQPSSLTLPLLRIQASSRVFGSVPERAQTHTQFDGLFGNENA